MKKVWPKISENTMAIIVIVIVGILVTIVLGIIDLWNERYVKRDSRIVSLKSEIATLERKLKTAERQEDNAKLALADQNVELTRSRTNLERLLDTREQKLSDQFDAIALTEILLQEYSISIDIMHDFSPTSD